MSELDKTEREELEFLREFYAQNMQVRADVDNPNVILLEGKLDLWGTEYYALSVTTDFGNTVYIAELLNEAYEWKKDIISFSWHVSSERKSFYELEDHLVKTAMGIADTKYYHAYSDLTGYLWTEEKLKVGGHDVLEEIKGELNGAGGKARYIALRIERKSV